MPRQFRDFLTMSRKGCYRAKLLITVNLIYTTTSPFPLQVVSLKGCWASVGQRYSETNLSLGRGCETAAAHELGHVIGLHHEQCRTDRDSYIKVIMGKVSKDMR